MGVESCVTITSYLGLTKLLKCSAINILPAFKKMLPEDTESHLSRNGNTCADGRRPGSHQPQGVRGRTAVTRHHPDNVARRGHGAETQWKTGRPNGGWKLTCAATWVNLEDTVPSTPVTMGRILDDPDRRYPGAQFGHRNQNSGCQGLGLGSGELVFSGDRVSVWKDEDILEMAGAGGGRGDG